MYGFTTLAGSKDYREISIERVLARLFRWIGNDDESVLNPCGEQIANDDADDESRARVLAIDDPQQVLVRNSTNGRGIKSGAHAVNPHAPHSPENNTFCGWAKNVRI